MNITKLHPQPWQRLQSWRERLPHALLFAGQRGLGKFRLAQAFAAGLLCEAPAADGRACGQCLACGWFAQHNHPDFRLLQPQALSEQEEDAKESAEGGKKKSQQITIDQVRALEGFFNVGAHRSGLRIILVRPAEAMNRNTANALLKTLEEPTPSTLFVLVTDEPMRLLPTIRSRCQTLGVALPAPDRAAAMLRENGVAQPDQWLALAGGAPWLALELAEAGQGGGLELLLKKLAAGQSGDPLASAADMDKALKDGKTALTLRQIVDWVQKWTVDLIFIKNGLPARYFLRQQATIAALVTATRPEALVAFDRQLRARRREAEQPLNGRLFLETVFLDYRLLFTP